MKTIINIIKNELKARVFSWITPIFFLMLVFQAIWYAKGSFDYYVNDGVLMNAPAIIYRNYAGLGMLMVIIIVITTGGVLYKDIQHKTADWLYTFPINEKKFFTARYLSAFLYLFIVSIGLFVGTMLMPYSGIGTANRFGEMPYLQTLHAILIFFIPNVLMYVSLIFCCLVYTKKMAVGYLASFLMVMLFVIMQSFYETGGESWAGYVLDPSGYVSLQNYLSHISTTEKNTGFVPLSGYLLLNRIVWTSISIVLFVLAFFKFSFKNFITAGKSDTIKNKFDNSHIAKLQIANHHINTRKKHSVKEYIYKLFRLAKIEFLNVVRPSSFKIIIGVICLMIFLQNVMFNANYYIGSEVPLTSNMTYFRLPWGVFIVILLMIWSGELFFKEKTVDIWQITDALPIPVWVTQTSKLIAFLGVAIVLCFSFMMIGIVSQFILGGGIEIIDFKRYLIDIFGFRWGLGNFMLFICLVFFIGGLTGNRLITHILSVGYFLFTIISFDMGLQEQARFGYAMTPGVEDFSELSGYGILQKSAHWFNFMWIALALAFVLIGIWLWNRGVTRSLKTKLKGNQLFTIPKILVFMLFFVFFGFQYYLNKQIYATENFEAVAQKETRKANYEKTYRYLSKIAHPKYQKIDLNIDYLPKKRTLHYQANIELFSKTNTDTLFLNFPKFISVEKIKIDNQEVKSVFKDVVHHLYKYKIPKKAFKDSIFNLSIIAKKQYVGLSQHELQNNITQNGSFANVKDFLPTIGYDSDRELTENRSREDNGLKKLPSRMAAIDDKNSMQEDYLCTDAEKVTGKITINVHRNQLPISAGKFIEKQEQGNRVAYTYKIKNPSSFNWCVGTADYKVFEKQLFKGVGYEIMANPKHPFNIAFYKNAIEKSIAFYQKIIPSFNVKELRFVEISHWNNDDFYNFPNTIAISEKQGWVADTSKLKEKAYIYQTVSAQIFKQYLQQNITIANVQGAEMLSTALPEAFGLLLVEQEFGKDGLDKIQQKKKDIYGKLRNNEPNTEPSLLLADGTDYLEANKGAIVLYEVIKEIGVPKIIDCLNNSNVKKTVRFYDFYRCLKVDLSEEIIKNIEENKVVE